MPAASSASVHACHSHALALLFYDAVTYPPSNSGYIAHELVNINVVPQRKSKLFETLDFPDPAEPAIL